MSATQRAYGSAQNRRFDAKEQALLAGIDQRTCTPPGLSNEADPAEISIGSHATALHGGLSGVVPVGEVVPSKPGEPLPSMVMWRIGSSLLCGGSLHTGIGPDQCVYGLLTRFHASKESPGLCSLGLSHPVLYLWRAVAPAPM